MTSSPVTHPVPEELSGPRSALIVATGNYTDARLARLNAVRDAAEMASVLEDRNIGAFKITALIDRTGQEIRVAVDEFLQTRVREEMVVVYLSCHGVLDRLDELYFAAADTRLDRPASTGVEATWVMKRLDQCRAAQQVVIFDCCHSGAFDRAGSKGESDPDLQLARKLRTQGRGRAVLTASRANQLAWESELVDGRVAPSVFTAALVQGLRSGKADTDDDGLISVNDAYNYAYEEVVNSGARQTPQRSISGGEGEVILARNPAPRPPRARRQPEERAVTDPAALPALLHQHGALVLDPVAAVEVSGSPHPDVTVYRSRTLLVPGDLLEQPAAVNAINLALSAEGMRLLPLAPDPGGRLRDGPVAEALQRLCRTAVLVPDARGEARGRPVRVDAWVALQTLRAAAADENRGLDRQAVSRISLEHLLTGPASAHWPTPETVPDRKAADYCAELYGRRPVIAVLDTGIGARHWLRVMTAGSGYQMAEDGFVLVDDALQTSIRREGEKAAASGDRPRQVFRDPWDTPEAEAFMAGDTSTGHGTITAEILRQLVPDARVLPMRIAHRDGVAYEGDLVCALSQLAARIADNDLGDSSAMVDVITLSLGYFSETRDGAHGSVLREVIDVLLAMGVIVVAAAGSLSTNRRLYPAAFAEDAPAGRAPLVSVGGLKPDGSSATASESHRWVTAWAVDSASPGIPTMAGDRLPSVRFEPRRRNRRADDPGTDDSADILPGWGSPALAAPRTAALIVGEMLAGAADPALRLDVPGTQAAANRAVAALGRLGWAG